MSDDTSPAPASPADPDSIATAGGRLEPGTTDPIDAATVLLLRDADSGSEGGLEVFLLERHLKSDFAGGAYAFPGGKVDPTDLELDASRWTGVDPRRTMARVGARTPEHAVGLLVAAVRETFEEAGPLLAWHADGRPVTTDDLASDSFLEARQRLATRGEHWDWRPWLEAEDLVLDLGALRPFVGHPPRDAQAVRHPLPGRAPAGRPGRGAGPRRHRDDRLGVARAVGRAGGRGAG